MNWTPAKDIVGAGARGRARIEQFTVSEHDSRFQAIRGTHLPAGEYTRLISGGVLWMSDTPDERRSNIDFVINARGDVLVGGLGLGWCLTQALLKSEVDRITVVERDPDIIALVAPRLPNQDKLEIVEADVLTWRPPKGRSWDTIYFDIWADICESNLDEVSRLKRRFARRRRAGGWMGAWQEDYLRRLRERGGWR